MNWEEIVGQEGLKESLKDSIANNRVGHAQLFIGKEGYGVFPLALAFAQELFLKENAHAAPKIKHFNHVDLHLTFPVFKEKNVALSQNFFDDFREMMLQNPYANSEDWSRILESENKQLTIYSEEIEQLNQKFSLKSFEGGSKVLIVWQADKMNNAAANKFLKFLEEPPEKTYIILCAESIDRMLPTITSRSQIIEVPRISDDEMEKILENDHAISNEKRNEIIFQAQGDYNIAQKLSVEVASDDAFLEFFISWVRNAVMVKKNPKLLKNIVLWGRTIATWNREKQKNFLEFCAEFFRLAMLENYGNQNLVYKKPNATTFKWKEFSKFIHGGNIEDILTEISQADYHLERNANAKIVWTDLGIKLSRYLFKKI